MECHRCWHRFAIKAGTYRNVPFERTPCSRCELKERSIFSAEFREGQSDDSGERPFVRMDCVDLERLTTVDRPFPEEYDDDDDSLMPLSVLAEAVVHFMMLPAKTRDVICWRFAGMRYKEIARRLGVTVAAAELRHRRALDRWPALREMFVEKAAKQLRRKSHRRRGEQETGQEQGVACGLGAETAAIPPKRLFSETVGN